MPEVGEAWVSLKPSAKGFGSATEAQVGPQMQQAGKSTGSRFGGAFKVAAVAAIGGLAAAGKFIYGATQQASDLAETGSKVGVIFGKASAQVERFADRGAAKLGQTKQEVLDAAATFGTFGKAADLQGPQLAKFSTKLVGLSTDLSSFFNTDPKQAADAIGSALRGEAEPIRQFGVLLDDATLKAEAMRLGLLKPVKDKAKILAYQTNVTVAQRDLNKAIAEHGKGSIEALKAQAKLGTSQSSLQKATAGTIPPLTQQQKVLAAQSSIMKQTRDAQGDFERTSGGLANQQRILSASFTDLKTKIGTIFLPIMVRIVKFINANVVPALDSFIKGVQSGEGVGGKFKAAFGPIGSMLGDIGSKLGAVDFSKLTDGINTDKLKGDFGKLGEAIGNIDTGKIKEAFSGAVNDTISVFSVVIGFAADHVDDLAKHLPLLIGALLAYKAAQALSNVVALAQVPIQLANVAALFASAGANRALATQMMITNGVEKTSMLTRARATVVTIASTIAQKVAAAATKAWAATQWLLNAALTANPLGIVIALLVGLVAGLIIAWKRSDRFREIVTAAFEKIKSVASAVFEWLTNAVMTVIGWIKDHWKTLVAIFGGPLGLVVLLVHKHWDAIKSFISDAVGKIIGFVKRMGQAIWERIKDVARFVTGLKEKFGNAIDYVKDIPGKVLDALVDFGSLLYDKGKELIQGLIDGITDKIEDVKDAVGKVADAVGKFWPGSPIKEGPLKSWNNGGAGKRLVGMLADGLSDTAPVTRAARDLASTVRIPSLGVDDSVGSSTALAGAARGGIAVHIDKVEPHDYRAFMGDLQRRTQRAALGGFA